MRTAFFDCSKGVSGDMILGALVSAGFDFDVLTSELQKCPATRLLQLERKSIPYKAATATRIEVRRAERSDTSKHPHRVPHRHLDDVLQLIRSSALEKRITERAVAMFERLAAAEAAVHGTTMDHVHLHEVAADDALADFIGVAIGIDYLGIDRVYSGPVVVGSGTVVCSHGEIPVPVPAVRELLRHYPWEHGPTSGERCTPTGAAILTALSAGVNPGLTLRVDCAGYGAGSKWFDGFPGVLRIEIGEEISSGSLPLALDAIRR